MPKKKERKSGIDWSAARQRYISSTISTRALAEEIGASYSAVRQKSIDDGWVEAREVFDRQTVARMEQRASEARATECSRLFEVSTTLLERILELAQAEDLKAADARALTAAIRDLQQIRGEKSKLDIEEQEARIAKLRHDVEQDKPKSVQVEIVGLPEGFDV